MVIWAQNETQRYSSSRHSSIKNSLHQVLEMVMILVGAQPWLIQSRGDQHSQGGREVKTPKNTRKSGDHADGSDKSESRVSSGSTLKTAKKQPRLSRQMTRTSTSSFGKTLHLW